MEGEPVPTSSNNLKGSPIMYVWATFVGWAFGFLQIILIVDLNTETRVVFGMGLNLSGSPGLKWPSLEAEKPIFFENIWKQRV